MDEIAHKWRDIGQLLDIPHGMLEGISMKYQHDPKECCRSVLAKWLENPPSDYPPIWQGLFDLLEDSQLGQVVTELKTALAKYGQLQSSVNQ